MCFWQVSTGAEAPQPTTRKTPEQDEAYAWSLALFSFSLSLLSLILFGFFPKSLSLFLSLSTTYSLFKFKLYLLYKQNTKIHAFEINIISTLTLSVCFSPLTLHMFLSILDSCIWFYVSFSVLFILFYFVFWFTFTWLWSVKTNEINQLSHEIKDTLPHMLDRVLKKSVHE